MTDTFGRDRRVRARPDFDRVQRLGLRAVSAHFVFLVAAREATGGAARLGLVVSRKVGHAVARNRVKRLCRECFRRGLVPLPDGIDLVVIARAGAEGLSFDACAAEWRAAQRKIGRHASAALADRKGGAHDASVPRP